MSQRVLTRRWSNCPLVLPRPSPVLAPQGVGRATALLFARKGWNVVVAARDATKLAYVVEDCAAAAGRAGAALAVPTDVTQVGWRRGWGMCLHAAGRAREALTAPTDVTQVGWWRGWWWSVCVSTEGGGGSGGGGAGRAHGRDPGGMVARASYVCWHIGCWRAGRGAG